MSLFDTDDIFGNVFDVDGDGKTDFSESMMFLSMVNEAEKEDAGSDLFDADGDDLDGFDDLDDGPDFGFDSDSDFDLD